MPPMSRPARGAPRALAAAIVSLLVLQVAAVVVHRAADDGPTPTVADVAQRPTDPTPTPAPSPSAAPVASAEPAEPEPEPGAASPGSPGSDAPPEEEAAPPSDDGLRAITTDEDQRDDAPPPAPAPAPAPDREARSEPADPARQRFEQAFPAQAGAGQDARDPATTRWAVVVGINEHQGRVRDNVGSRQDAEELALHLRQLGWRDDHVLLLTDATATYENITQAIAWLARKTDGESVAVFHYSGHTKKWYGQDADGDGEVTDEGLWPSDNRYIIDSEWVARMAHVGAGRLWVNIGGCEAAGLADPGLARAGRLLTFSSTESQKSYEDPGVSNSVWGYYLFDEGLLRGRGDRDGDGNVTVEEAFNHAAPRAAQRTQGQRYGPQQAVVIDDVPGDFDLRIPPPPPEPEPEPSEDDDDDDDGCGAWPLCSPTQRRP